MHARPKDIGCFDLYTRAPVVVDTRDGQEV